MTTHEHAVVVERPITTVYAQWTQFESYPEFMDNVESVEQLDDALTHWKVSVAGVEREYDAQILEQRPSEVISWESLSGPRQSGRVSFSSVDAERTQVTLRLDFEPHGVTEKLGDAVGVVSSGVEGSLERFKDYIEDRGTSGGPGWQGTIADGVPVKGTGARDPYTASPPSSLAPPIDLREPGESIDRDPATDYRDV